MGKEENAETEKREGEGSKVRTETGRDGREWVWKE